MIEQSELKNEQMDRYNRNIIIENISKAGQKKLLASRVLVAGCGGLGSTVIANLASLGVGHIGLVDNDCLELSNLNRQYIHKLSAIGELKTKSAKKWIEQYNKDIEVETFEKRLNKENFSEIVKDYDYIVDCFDSFQSKLLLNDIALMAQKILISGGVCEFKGQVMTIIPQQSACLRCLFPEADKVDYQVKGVISPTVSTIASIESMELVKLILNQGELLTNKMLVFDGLNMKFKIVNAKINANCICQKLF